MDAEKIREKLLNSIDATNAVQLEKVNRYMNLLSIYYSLDEEIEKSGPVVVTENGAQRFIKVNPAIAEKNKINGSLLALEKSFNFDDEPKITKRTLL